MGKKIETRGRKPKLVMDKDFAKLYGKKTNEEIAKEYNVTVSAVQKMARKNGLRKTETGRPCAMPDMEELVAMCDTHTDKELAVHYKVCVGTIAYWRKKAGISKYDKNSDIVA